MGSVKLGLFILWISAIAGQALSTGGIQISPLSNLVIAQCAILNLTWTGGTPPFFIRFGTFDDSGTIGSGISTFNFSLLVNLPAGTQVAIGVGDTFDTPAISEFTVAPSSNSSCLVGTTPTGANPTTDVSQPTDTALPFSKGSGISHSNIAPIGGGAAGGAIVLLLIGLRVWYIWRRRQPSNTVLPTTTPVVGTHEDASTIGGPAITTPMFGTHQGVNTIGGAATPIPGTGGVSTQNPVLSQMGYQTHAYDPNKVETSRGGTSAPPMPTDEPTLFEVPYGRNRVPQTIFVANPGPIMPAPSHRVHSRSSTGGVDGGMRMTTDADSKTMMSWGPPSSQTASSAASPFLTPPPGEQELEQRLGMLESRMSTDMAPPAYNNQD
ncbi:hypothetical protein K438DRAFT_1946787 [Mycena galopus ATCC 62051]|nr:hypothetical protein K438DRAFT_1946787 [Mycena galopus ATCC 62051]